MLYSLAYAEIYMTLAVFARCFDMELFETTEDNIRFVRELGVACPKEGHLGVKAVVTGIVNE